MPALYMPGPIQNPLLVAFIVALIGFMIGLAKGGLGAGLGTLATAMLSLVLPNPSLAVGIILPMLMAGDAFAVYTYWSEWDGRLVRRLLPGAVVGVLAGTFLLTNLSAGTMRMALAIFTLTIIAYKLVSDLIRRLRYRSQPWHATVAGVLSGFTSALFNAGGPPFNAYLLLQDVTPRTFIATTAIFFAAVNLLKVPAFVFARVLSLPTLASLWWAFLFIPLGIWAGRQLINRINQSAFEWIILGLLLLSSGLLLWESLEWAR